MTPADNNTTPDSRGDRAAPDGGPGNGFAEYLANAERTGVPVAAVLTGFAYLRHLARLRRRAAERLPLFEDGPPDLSDFDELDETGPPLPGGRPRDSLRVVECAGCGRVLLAESEEPLRAAAEHAPSRRAPRPPLPPPVAARAIGRPYCAGCLDRPIRRAGT